MSSKSPKQISQIDDQSIIDGYNLFIDRIFSNKFRKAVEIFLQINGIAKVDIKTLLEDLKSTPILTIEDECLGL